MIDPYRSPARRVGNVLEQPGGELPNYMIAARAAVEVVYFLERVDVQQDQRVWMLLPQVAQQPLPIGQAGERIGIEAVELAQGTGHHVEDEPRQ